MGLLSGVTDAIGITDSGGGAEVAREAGNFSREATNKAKESYWDNYNDSKQLLDDGRIASLRALQNGKNGAQTALLLGNTRAENELGENYGLARQQLQPLADLGMGAMERLNYGSTAEGFASNVNNLLDGGALAPLIAENQRNLEAELAAQGLTRSGAGIRDLSQLPIETIMGIEGMLQGRNSEVASYGLPAVTNQAQLYTQEGDALASLWSNGGINAANIESGYGQGSAGLYSDYFNTRANNAMNYGRDLVNMELGLGENLASATLAGAQANASDRSGLANITGQGIGALGSWAGGGFQMPGGG